MKLTPNITLSNGRIIGSRYMNGVDGSQDLFDVADPERVANLTEAESAEVMAAIREFRNPQLTQTFQYQIGEPGCDLDPANWQEIEACTMRDAVVPALQREAEARKVPMPSIVYLSGPDDFKHSNGAPFAVHAFEVTQ